MRTNDHDPEAELAHMRTAAAELRRVVATGALWFASGTVTFAIVTAGPLSAGWRPGAAAPALQAMWWVGLAVSLLGLGCTAWAGCPVLGPDLNRAGRQKSLFIRLGVASFAVGLIALVVTLSVSQ